MRSLFESEQGKVFVNSTDEKYLLTDNGFMPTDIETDDLEQIRIDITVQGTIDNAQLKFDSIKAEIAEAIQNFE